jgi:hypothetical protein
LISTSSRSPAGLLTVTLQVLKKAQLSFGVPRLPWEPCG